MRPCVKSVVDATKEDVVATFGVPASKVHVVYNAVTHPNRSRDPQPGLVLYAGRLTTNKGVHVLLKAFQIARETAPDLRLTLLGGTEDQVAAYQKMAQDSGIESAVTFEGSQPKNKVLDAFAKASFVVVPSLSEGFGFVVIEAFSVGTPVIGSNTGGIKEIVRDGVDGQLVEPGDHNALAATLIALHNDADLLLKYGVNAHQRFLDTFELRLVVDQLNTYLQSQLS
ncbi:MAG: glycosyltransferase family 4 protein [Bacteroidota bacterium]